LVLYALRNLIEAGVTPVTAVVGHNRGEVMKCLGQDVKFAIQDQQLGTGHAVAAAFKKLPAGGHVVVLFGDCPFLDAETISLAIAQHKKQEADVTLSTAVLSDPRALGRLRRDDNMRVLKIEEGRLAGPGDPAEVFAGLSVWRRDAQEGALPELPERQKGDVVIELDLPDAVAPRRVCVSRKVKPLHPSS
jgi:bifunctional N-acetylglucosamine-1-phosphate-uridyltransferase/glucosamine-1-phosphate-acetyltransferase GlmU-like protein